MAFCPANDTTVPNTTFMWGEISPLISQRTPHCGEDFSSYLRPNSAGNVIPYVYAALLLFFHLPSNLIRVVRWSKAQWYLVSLTWIEIASYCITYWSTKLNPDAILVWSPLLMQQSAGVMLHVFVLMAEQKLWVLPTWESAANFFSCRRRRRATVRLREDLEMPSLLHVPPSVVHFGPSTPNIPPASPTYVVPFEPPTPNVSHYASSTPDAARSTASLPVPKPPSPFSSRLVIIPLMTFVIIFVVQGIGAFVAIRYFNSNALFVSWCSPVLQPFADAVVDGDCNIYAVDVEALKGVGCIKLPASMQKGWLRATAIVTPFLMLTQLVDLSILCFVTSGYRSANRVKMRRPWFTMIAGQLLIVFVCIYGCIHAYNLPGSITKDINIVTQNANNVTVCSATITAAGLRGSIIAWTDGVFSGLASLYYGPLDQLPP